MRTRPWCAAVLLAGAVLIAAVVNTSGEAVQPAPFSAVQLEQIVAPIALYPDALLTQTLMAATYPLEIVESARWLAKNPSLTGSALEDALKAEDWDPSVKSLCAFPAVLQKMNENIDWMKDLGDAFLGQQEELLAEVQRMRAKAYASGNLKSTGQQTVTQPEPSVIVIESAAPEVVYVPTYSPIVVYGGWSYPSYYYPRMYVPPPPGVGFLTFTAGVAVGAAVWGHADWGHHSVSVDVNRYNSFNRNTSVRVDHYGGGSGNGSHANWEHNAEHRKGVNYNNASTAQRYGGSGPSGQVNRDQARGRGGQLTGSGAGAPSGSRPSGGDGRPTGGGASASTRDVPRNASSGSSSGRSPSSNSGSSAYSGSRSSSASTSAASNRGASSRGTSSYSGSSTRPSSSMSRPSGGGSRPSGGGGARGGRR